MNARVAAFSFAQRAIHFSSQHNSSILKYQEQISSGLQFQKPSEQPIAFRQVTSLKSRFTELTADRSSIDRATSVLNASVSQLEGVTGIINRAKVLTQQGIQSLDDDERTALALEVDGLLNQMKDIALTRFNDKYLYGGTKSETPPFQFSERESGELSVDYSGSERRSRASVGDSISVDTYYSGVEIFGGRGREDTVLVGTTGAQTGRGTDTLTGRTTLKVSHLLTTFSGSSGVQAGASSALGDTILGPSGTHQLTVVDTAGDGSGGTVSLNGAEPIAFTSADTNLKVTGSHGQEIFVDLSNISAGFNATVDIESTGSMTVDGGASSVPIDFTDNQVVADSVSGKAVTIDSTDIRVVGSDQLEFPGTSDVFQVLSQLASDLRNTRGLDSRDLALSLDRRLGELSGLGENIFETIGEQATSLRTMETLGFRIDDLMLSVETEISDVQATDLPDAVLRMENAQALLQYTYAVTADLTSLGLLDFLR